MVILTLYSLLIKVRVLTKKKKICTSVNTKKFSTQLHYLETSI